MNVLSKRSVALAGICAFALSGVLLYGCSSSGSDQEILDKLNQMEGDIAQLKDSQAASGEQNASSGQGDASASGSAAASEIASADDLEATIADLESRAAGAVETADAVVVPQDPSARPQAYFDAKAPLEALEHEADTFEDRIEEEYRQGSLDRETFWTLDQRVSVVENSLDSAADNLERRMGVDD